jgi:hypothetical protein
MLFKPVALLATSLAMASATPFGLIFSNNVYCNSTGSTLYMDSYDHPELDRDTFVDGQILGPYDDKVRIPSQDSIQPFPKILNVSA